MASRAADFKKANVKRALQAALAAGVTNPKLTLTLPNGLTLVIEAGDEQKPRAAGAGDEWDEALKQ